MNSKRFKHIDFSHHFLLLKYRGLNLNFLKLAQLMDGDIESNAAALQNDFKSPHGWPKKNKVFTGTAKKCDLSEKVTFNVVSVPNVQNVFFNAIQSVSLNIIKPWSVTYPCIIDSFQKMQYEVNYTINSKVSLRRGDIIKINETLFGGGKLLIELSMKLQEAPRSQDY